MSRGPSIRIPSVGQPLAGGDALDFVRRVGAEPKNVDVVFAGTGTASARHGLGRRYVGGIVIGISEVHSSAFEAYLPEVAATNGVDPTVYIQMCTKNNYTGTVRVRVL